MGSFSWIRVSVVTQEEKNLVKSQGSSCTAATEIVAVNPVVNISQSALNELARIPVQILLWQHQVSADVRLVGLNLCCALQCSSIASHDTQEHWLKPMYISGFSQLSTQVFTFIGSWP